MGSAAIAGTNLADSGTIAGEQLTDNPVANLLNPDVEQRWRAPTNTGVFVANLGGLKSFNCIILRGFTGGASSTMRIRVSTSDASGAAGDVLDTGTIIHGSAYFDVDYDALVYVRVANITGCYVRFDITDPAASYVEAGRLGVFDLTSFTYNASPGWSIGFVDRSVVEVARGGQDQVWPDNCYRLLEFPLRWVTTTQRFGIVQTLDRNNGRRTDVVICLDRESTNLPRDTIMGLVQELTPVVQPDLIFGADGPIYGKHYKIKERL